MQRACTSVQPSRIDEYPDALPCRSEHSEPCSISSTVCSFTVSMAGPAQQCCPRLAMSPARATAGGGSSRAPGTASSSDRQAELPLQPSTSSGDTLHPLGRSCSTVGLASAFLSRPASTYKDESNRVVFAATLTMSSPACWPHGWSAWSLTPSRSLEVACEPAGSITIRMNSVAPCKASPPFVGHRCFDHVTVARLARPTVSVAMPAGVSLAFARLARLAMRSATIDTDARCPGSPPKPRWRTYSTRALPTQHRTLENAATTRSCPGRAVLKHSSRKAQGRTGHAVVSVTHSAHATLIAGRACSRAVLDLPTSIDR